MDIIELLRNNNINDIDTAVQLIKNYKKTIPDKPEQIATSNIAINSILGVSDKILLRNIINPSVRYRNAYILLDTNNLDLTQSDKYHWNIVNYITNKKGCVTIPHNTKNLVAMRMFPMNMIINAPIKEPGKTNYINNTVNVNYLFTVLIEELKTQSYIGRNNQNYHFILQPSIKNFIVSSDYYYIVPDQPYMEFSTKGMFNGWFWFKQPINNLSSITTIIRDPFTEVSVSQNERTMIQMELVFIDDEDTG